MNGPRRRADVAEVLALIESRTRALPGESVPLHESAGRVLAEAVVSSVNVPGFAKSAMDGFAVRAADTGGAGPHSPLALVLVGESLPARPFAGTVEPGEAVRILTGAPFPAGADAVLMAEFAHLDGNRVQVRQSVAPGKHVIRLGEDVAKGTAVLPKGRRLRPQDVGQLASVGIARVEAVRRPRVAILVTGNELLPPGSTPTGFQIVDSNSPMLAALAARDGAIVLPVRTASDDAAAIRAALLAAAAEADVILVSGGTSVGTEDHTARVAAELGELAVHGVAIKPGAPLGVGSLPATSEEGEKGRRGEEYSSAPSHPWPLHPLAPHSPPILFLLPGNPVACLCAYDLFAGRAVRRLGGRAGDLPYRQVTLPLAGGVASSVGRVDYVRVKVEGGKVIPLATGGASNLSTAVAADGFALVPGERDGLAPGEVVEVWLYDT